MKSTDLWDQYRSYTRDVTEHSRKLGFAGAAICWALKAPNGSFESPLLLALSLFVLFFITDVLQGLSAALLLRMWIRSEEIKNWRKYKTLDGEYLKPVWLDRPAFILFLIKILFLLGGFTVLAIFILYR